MPSSHSRRAVVAATSLAALAGCIGDSELLDPAANTSEEPQFPPGVSDDELDDHETLLASHRDQLLSTGFVLELDVRESTTGADEPDIEIDYTIESGPDGTPYGLSGTIEWGDESETVDRWVTESETVEKRDRGDGPLYQVTDTGGDLPSREFLTPSELLVPVESGTFAVDVIEDRGGTTVTTLVAEEFDGDETDTEAATLVVDAGGVIREASIELADGTGSFGYDVVAVGSGTPEEPEWLADVPESAFGDVDVHVDPTTSGDALTFESRGEDPVPAGTTVTVRDADATYRGTIEDSLASGEGIYLSIQDGSLAVSDDRPSTVDASFESPISVTVASADSVVFVQASMAWSSSSSSEGGSSDSTGSSSSG